MIEKKTNKYLISVQEATSEEERKVRQAEFKSWYHALPEEDQATAQKVMQADREEIKNELRVLQGIADLALKGSIHYEGEEYLLGEWVTIADYARLHNLKLNRVTNWIKREVIPAENVKVFPALNNLRLVRNEAYRTG